MADVEEGSSMPSPGSKLCTGKIKSKSPELGRISGTALPRIDSPIDVLSSIQKDDVLKKLYLHLLPKFFILTVLCYVDRYACPFRLSALQLVTHVLWCDPAAPSTGVSADAQDKSCICSADYE